MNKKKGAWSSAKSKSAKAILPLSIVFAMLSAGTVFAKTEYVDIDLGNGKVMRYDSKLMKTNASYMRDFKQALLKASVSGTVVVKDSENDAWIKIDNPDILSPAAIVQGDNTSYSSLIGDEKSAAKPIATAVMVLDSKGRIIRDENLAYMQNVLANAKSLLAGGKLSTAEYNKLKALIGNLEKMLEAPEKFSTAELKKSADSLNETVADTDSSYRVETPEEKNSGY